MPVSPAGIPLAVTREANAVRTSPPDGVRLVQAAPSTNDAVGGHGWSCLWTGRFDFLVATLLLPGAALVVKMSVAVIAALIGTAIFLGLLRRITFRRGR